MKKYSMRVLACFMACVIAFNVIAIPKAKASAAVVGTSALATSALASYMTATGVPLTVVSGGAAAASAGTASLVGGYAAATGATYEVVTTAIAAGATISGGTIILGAAAVAVLAGIVAWAIDEYGLIGEDGAPVTEPVGVVPGSAPVGFAFYGGAVLPNIETVWTDRGTYPYAYIIDFSTRTDLDFDYILRLASHSAEQQTNGAWYVPSSCNWKVREYLYYTGDSEFTLAGDSSVPNQYYPITSDASEPVIWSSVDMLNLDGTLYLAGSECGSVEDWENPSVSVSLDADYVVPSEVPETKQVVLDTGLADTIAPDVVPDAIFESIASNEFAPTYAEEPVADAAPDTGGDTGEGSETNPDASEDTGLLRRIAIACEALADKILGGIESLFAPDAELMQEISDTFNSKFGFVSTLHQLGADLLAIDATSAPPVVYIHLEDAEGSIYYGETVKALDMSWYARYKPDVDRIMSGFLWLGFLWLLFKRASAIIQGAEMATDYGVDVHDGYRIRGERNGKRF